MPSQEQLILREIRRPNIPPLYNECVQLRMRGPLDLSAVKKSLLEIIRRHDIWRTTYRFDQDRVRQVIHPAKGQIDIPVVDLQGYSQEQQEHEINQTIGALVQEPFNLIGGPLLRAHLFKLNELEHRLYLIAHLSIIDGLSVYDIFPTELAALYRAHIGSRSVDLPPLPIQVADFAQWQANRTETECVSRQLEYWRSQLAGRLVPLNWPAIRPRPPQETFRGEIENFLLPLSLASTMKALARAEGVTLFMVLLSVFAALLLSYTHQDDFIIGTPSPSGRKESDLHKLLGYFLTPVALRFRITRNMSFRELLRQAQRLTIEAISNDDLTVEALTQKLNIPPDPSRNPLFTVATSLQPPTPRLDFDWTVTSMDFSSGGAPWDLYLAFIDGREGLLGRVQYNPDLFEPDTIGRFVQDYKTLAHVLTTNPEIHLPCAGFHA